jgi:hypothetical protein
LEEDTERTVRFTKPTSEWVEDDFGHGRIEEKKKKVFIVLNISKIISIIINAINR